MKPIAVAVLVIGLSLGIARAEDKSVEKKPTVEELSTKLSDSQKQVGYWQATTQYYRNQLQATQDQLANIAGQNAGQPKK